MSVPVGADGLVRIFRSRGWNDLADALHRANVCAMQKDADGEAAAMADYARLREERDARETARRAAEEAAWQETPATEIMVRRPADCFRDVPQDILEDRCAPCIRDRHRTEVRQHDGETRARTVYLTDQCHRVVIGRRLMERSGLDSVCPTCDVLTGKGCPRSESARQWCAYQHTFAAATRDANNRAVLSLLETWDPAEGISLYLLGQPSHGNPAGVGTGKSYACHALVHRLCFEGIRARFICSADYLRRLRAGYNDDTITRARNEDDAERATRGKESEESIIASLTSPTVIVLDDFGAEAFSEKGADWAGERFYQIVEHRSKAGKPIVFTSNLTPQAACERFGTVYGARLLSRIMGMVDGRVYALGGPDRRRTEGQRSNT